VLTVADGASVARISLEGNYTESAFTLSSDGHGGTTVVDPTTTASVNRFVAAAAGFGAGETAPMTHDAGHTHLPQLTIPAAPPSRDVDLAARRFAP
jgi:hypothetical protein